jgi:hypothetical protein
VPLRVTLCLAEEHYGKPLPGSVHAVYPYGDHGSGIQLSHGIGLITTPAVYVVDLNGLARLGVDLPANPGDGAALHMGGHTLGGRLIGERHRHRSRCGCLSRAGPDWCWNRCRDDSRHRSRCGRLYPAQTAGTAEEPPHYQLVPSTFARSDSGAAEGVARLVARTPEVPNDVHSVQGNAVRCRYPQVASPRTWSNRGNS